MPKPIIQAAVKSQSRLRMAVFGPSSSGKTMTSLRIAKGLGGSVGLIDTEHGSASLYADRYPFDTVVLDDYDTVNYIEAIEAFAAAKYDVLIIDSLSHAWEWILAYVDKLGAGKYKGNKWGAWSDASPKHQALIEAMLAYPGHIIATMRSKTEWLVQQDDRGKGQPIRVGLAPKQREGMEYEFGIVLEMNVDNLGHVLKDRTGRYQGQIIEKPGEKFGTELAEWLNEGAPLIDPPRRSSAGEFDDRGEPINASTLALVGEFLARLDFPATPEGKTEARRFIGHLVKRPVSGARDLTMGEARIVLEHTPDDAADRLAVWRDSERMTADAN